MSNLHVSFINIFVWQYKCIQAHSVSIKLLTNYTEAKLNPEAYIFACITTMTVVNGNNIVWCVIPQVGPSYTKCIGRLVALR